MFLLDIDMYDYGPPTSAADNQEESLMKGEKKRKENPQPREGTSTRRITRRHRSS